MSGFKVVKTANNEIAKILCQSGNYSYLDSNNILWKHEPNWIGKKCAQMKDLSYKWIEEIKDESQVKKYL
jgi:hypothetical protein